MRITTVGRESVGGGLAARWRNAGHDVTELGPDGGDASDADAVLVAVPSEAIDDALSKVTGLEGKVVIDATNDFRGIDEYGARRSPRTWTRTRAAACDGAARALCGQRVSKAV